MDSTSDSHSEDTSDGSQETEDAHRAQVGYESIERASRYLEQEEYDKAIAHFLLGLSLVPRQLASCRDKFVLAVSGWGERIAATGQLEQLFSGYEQACKLYPTCHKLLNIMGSQLFRLGYIDEAACYFRRALHLAPDFLLARENLDNLCGHLVERWHFRMLNDVTRNRAYQRAVHAALAAGHRHVLDIGAGTGLLSMFAVEGQAHTVHACEMTKTMFEVSRDVIRANHMQDDITLLNKKSTELLIPQDLPHKVDLVVTETFDAGLLGEQVVDTLIHAWDELMADAETVPAAVIPSGARVYICAIESESVRRHNRPIYPGLADIDLADIPIMCRTAMQQGSDNAEPYTTERLEQPPGNYKRLTDVMEAFTVDFSHSERLRALKRGMTLKHCLAVRRPGHLDAIAMWFDLTLWEDLTLSSAPGCDSCWEQAVFPVLKPHFHTGSPPQLLVEPGNVLHVKCTSHHDSLHFTCTRIDRNTDVSCEVIAKPVLSDPPPSCAELCLIENDEHANIEVDVSVQYDGAVVHPTYDPPAVASVNNERYFTNVDESVEPWDNAMDLAESNALLLSQKLFEQSISLPLPDNHVAFPTTCCSPSTVAFEADVSDNCKKQKSREYIHLLERHQLGQLNDLDLNTSLCAAFRSVVASKCFPSPCVGNTEHSVTKACLDNAYTVVSSNRTNDVTRKSESHNSVNGKCGRVSNGSDLLFCNSHRTKGCSVATSPVRLCVSICGDQVAGESRQLRVLELARGLSVLPLQMVLIGAAHVASTQSDPEHRRLLNTIATANLIPLSRITWLQDVDEGVQLSRPHQPRNQSGDSDMLASHNRYHSDIETDVVSDSSGELYDILVADLVDGMGCLHQNVLSDVAIARCSTLTPQSTVIPDAVVAYGMAIHSTSLLRDSALVDDTATLGFQVAGFINDFQMRTHMDVDLPNLEYTKLCEPVEFFTLHLNEPLAPGQVPKFLDQSCRLQLRALNAAEVTAVVYWFQLHLAEGVKVSTLDRNLHFRQAAVIQKRGLTVVSGEMFTLMAACKNSCIDVTVVVPMTASKPSSVAGRPRDSLNDYVESL